MPSQPISSRCRGFTLIEVLVAITLLAIISLLVWQSMGSSVVMKERFEKKDQDFQAVTLAMNRISRDLQAAVLFSNVEILGVSAGGEQMTKSAFIGTNAGDQDKITFQTLAHLRYFKDVKESDLAEASYFLEPMTDEDRGEDVSGLFRLRKRETSPPDADPEQGGAVTTLLTGVKELNFRYYNQQKNEFVDEWDSTKLDNIHKLPRAVEIVLVVRDPVDEEGSLQFSTVVLLEMAPGPNDF